LSEDAGYALTMIESHLDRCMVYASYRGLLIRPLIPPTTTHRAFANPDRRLYMSATLGAGGELERAFGRPPIHRIPIPKG
jgi:Rad3-related DNA helicase